MQSSSVVNTHRDQNLFDTRKNRASIFEKIINQAIIPAKTRTQDKTQNIKKELDKKIEEGELPDAIRALQLLDDLETGVDSTCLDLSEQETSHFEVKGQKHPHDFLFRSKQIDRSEIKPDYKTETKKAEYRYHNWAIMGLNCLDAAIKIVSLKTQQNVSTYLISQAKKFIHNMQNSLDPEVEYGKFIHSVVIPYLLQQWNQKEVANPISAEEAEKIIIETRDFNNFDQNILSMATEIEVPIAHIDQKSQSEVKKYLHVNVPMTGHFSKEQKKEFETLANVAATEEELKNIIWYRSQKEHIQLLIRHHAKDILAGKMIPTQLRKYIPGMRNMWHERIYAMEGDTARIILESHHSGTPAHSLKAGSAEATEASLKQADRLMGLEERGASSVILSLLSPEPHLFGGPKFLTRQMQNALEDNKNSRVVLAGVPLNGFRRINSLIEDGLKCIVNKADEILKQKKDELTELKYGSDQAASLSANMHEEKSTSPAQDDTERKVKLKENIEELELAIEEFKRARQASFSMLTFLKGDRENANLSLVSAAVWLAHCVNEANGKPILAVDYACESGKDRVGIVSMKTISYAIFRDIDRNEKAIDRKQQDKKIIHAVTQSGQARKLTAMAGATLGTKGIKKDSDWCLPASWRDEITPVIKYTASYNKKLPKDPRMGYSGWKVGLGVVGLLFGLALCCTGIGFFAGLAPAIASASWLVTAMTIGTSAAAIVKGTIVIGAVGAVVAIGTGCVLRNEKNKSKWYNRNSMNQQSKNNYLEYDTPILSEHLQPLTRPSSVPANRQGSSSNAVIDRKLASRSTSQTQNDTPQSAQSSSQSMNNHESSVVTHDIVNSSATPTASIKDSSGPSSATPQGQSKPESGPTSEVSSETHQDRSLTV